MVVLAFNEERTLEVVVREILDELRSLCRKHEVIIVDDGSTDRTPAIAGRLSGAFHEVSVVHHPENRGLGGGYRTGFATVGGDLVTFYPADGQFPAKIIAKFIEHVGAADMVLGYLPHRKGSLVSKVLSVCERLLYHLFFGRFPRYQGVMMFRRRLLDELPIISTGRGWAVVMELILRASRSGYRLVSVPTTIRPRAHGSSKVNNISSVWANLKQLLILRRHLWRGRS